MTIPEQLDRRFREAALAEGLADIAYGLLETPLGTLLVAASPSGLCRVSYDPQVEREEEELSRSFGLRVMHAPAAVDRARRELDEYFSGRRTRFELPLDVRVQGFARHVLERLGHVPYGHLTTYGTLAAEAGKPRAARAVGTVMNRNPLPIVLPCHRVVGASGALTGYGGGLERKRMLLELEGIALG
ncbi:MAG: methylated-DNA--[protein]-cysteine S-methyltransferase [Gaiellaceae bacterium]